MFAISYGRIGKSHGLIGLYFELSHCHNCHTRHTLTLQVLGETLPKRGIPQQKMMFSMTCAPTCSFSR